MSTSKAPPHDLANSELPLGPLDDVEPMTGWRWVLILGAIALVGWGVVIGIGYVVFWALS